MRRAVLAFFWVLMLIPSVVAAQSETVVRGGSAVYPGLDVNIMGTNGLRRLHVGFEAQCIDVKSAEAAASPVAIDAVIQLLRGQTVANLSTVRGKQELKSALVALLNRLLGGPRVVRILYLQFVII